MQFFIARRDLIGSGVHRKFSQIKAGTVIAVERVSLDTYCVCWQQDGVVAMLSKVPATPFTLLRNRLWGYTCQPSKGLLAAMSDVKPFNARKPGTFLRYTSKDTASTTFGIVEDDKGRQRECYITGFPQPGAVGQLAVLADLSIVFYPTV